MALHLKKLEDQTIVITGATTGIGLVTARMAARCGARVVLAARDQSALSQLSEEIRLANGEAVYIVADVGNEKDVHDIARTAIKQFGGFDTWVNNAGSAVYGHMLHIETEDHRREFETNFWGVVYGSQEAARHLCKRGEAHGGAIINIGSIASDRALPLLGMYSAAKHAVKGFTDAFRMELESMDAPISVTLIKPSSIATPFPQHAKNVMDETPTLPPPLYDPMVLARSILHCAEKPQRDLYIGGGGKLLTTLGYFAPRLVDEYMQIIMMRQMRSGRPEHRDQFSLHAPATDMQERIKYRKHVSRSSLYTKASLHPLLTAVLIASTMIGAAALRGYAASRRSRW